MADTEPTPIPPPTALAPQDVPMSDAPAASSPAPAPTTATNGNGIAAAITTIPRPPEVQKPPHLRMPEPADYDAKQGAINAREYLNAKITPHMLAATKMITCEPWNLPDNPLQIMGEYFLEKSKELEQGKRSESRRAASKDS